MSRTRFIEHQGSRVLLFDYAGIRDTAEAKREIAESVRVVATQRPEKSLLVMTDVTDARYDSEVVQALKQLAAHNTPYVKASAVVGVRGLQKVVYQAVVWFSKRNLQLFDTREAALAWLAQQR